MLMMIYCLLFCSKIIIYSTIILTVSVLAPPPKYHSRMTAYKIFLWTEPYILKDHKTIRTNGGSCFVEKRWYTLVLPCEN